ncbi:hypothetical protein BGZ90_009911, partial [Linnemannia elongata]
MLFSKTISAAVAIALATIATSFVEASPVRIPEGLVARSVESAAADASAAAYVPLSERTWTAEEIEEHHQWIKRSSSGINDWNCVPAAGKRPVVLVHGL